MNTIILLFFLCFSILCTLSQENCACCTPEHQQIDFLIGDWEVFNEQGDMIGENLIEPVKNHCIISKNRKGINGSGGKSFNNYNRADTNNWHQLWISNTGNNLNLQGTASGDKIILKSDLENEKGKFYNQIT